MMIFNFFTIHSIRTQICICFGIHVDIPVLLNGSCLVYSSLIQQTCNIIDIFSFYENEEFVN